MMTIEFKGINGNEEVYMDSLNAILGDTKRNSMIDLGCNLAPHTPKFGFKERTYMDILPRVLDHINEQQFFIQQDILKVKKGSYNVDVAFANDVIEHLSIKNGKKLLGIMESISTKQILFTPLGEMWVGNSGHPEEHASGWTPDMIKGYASIVFPDYHKVWGFGAWFLWKCEDIELDFVRVVNELKSKQWAK